MQPVGSTDNLPQIPEPDGSYMLNQKFVIPIYKKSAGICTCYSSHTSKALHCPLLSERATQKPTPICITTLEYTFDQQKRTKDINIPRRHPLLLCLWQQFQKVQIFEASRTKRQVNVFSIYMYFPLSHTSLTEVSAWKTRQRYGIINRIENNSHFLYPWISFL